MFDAAPAELQRMHTARKRPEWIAFIPREIQGVDVDEAIHAQWGPDGVSKYNTSTGDAVYMGHCEVNRFLETVASGFPKENSHLRRSI
jgi:hypothetical protein